MTLKTTPVVIMAAGCHQLHILLSECRRSQQEREDDGDDRRDLVGDFHAMPRIALGDRALPHRHGEGADDGADDADGAHQQREDDQVRCSR